MTRYFTDHTFRFLRALARHNERAWFHAHKQDYDTHVRDPLQRLVTDLQPDLAAVSLHFRADPRAVGGSLYRIQRDTRFANDKSPYKTWQGARLFHARRQELATPLYYLHVQRVAASSAPASGAPNRPRCGPFASSSSTIPQGGRPRPTRRRSAPLHADDGTAVRPPWLPGRLAFIDDLRHRSFVAWRPLDDDTVTGPRLRQVLAKDLRDLAPFVDYLCAALDLEF